MSPLWWIPVPFQCHFCGVLWIPVSPVDSSPTPADSGPTPADSAGVLWVLQEWGGHWKVLLTRVKNHGWRNEKPDEQRPSRPHHLNMVTIDPHKTSSALDTIFIYQSGLLPNSLHKCIWAIPDHPKKPILPWVPGPIKITNNDLLASG